MNLHFGATVAKKEYLYMDFDRLKEQFKRYETWNPNYTPLSKYEGGYDESYVHDVTAQLIAKTKQATSKY